MLPKNTNQNLNLVRHFLKETEKVLIARGESPELPIVSMPCFSKKVWGLHKGKLTVIGARTSVGKSALALQFAYDLAKQGKRILFLSLEQTVSELTERIFCYDRKIDNLELLTGKFHKYTQDWKEFNDSLINTRLVLSDGIGKTWQEIDGLIARLDPKPEVIFLDYIQNIKGSSVEKKEAIDEYVRHLREMAIRENFCAVICSQVNRSAQESEDREPQMHHLKHSGALEEMADVIILLHWPHKYDSRKDENAYKLIIAKNRNGRTGYMDIKFYPQFYRFEDTIEVTDKVRQVQEIFTKVKEWDEKESTVANLPYAND